MTDLLSHIADIPLYFVIGLEGIFHMLTYLPWPSWDELFKSLIIFCALWRPRQVLERYWLSRPIYKRRGRSFPTTRDHQAASSSLDDIFHH
jgi:hypothetical protein